MVTVRIISSRIEADMAVGLLQASGIDAVVNGTKEYASVVTGHDLGRFEIMVEEECAEEANRILNTIEPAEKPMPPLRDARESLNRAIVFALMGAIIIPVIFNYVSVVNLIRYYEASPKVPRTFMITAFVVLLNFVAVASLILFAQFILP